MHDPDGEMFAELAANGQADALVSFIGGYQPAIPAHLGWAFRCAGRATS